MSTPDPKLNLLRDRTRPADTGRYVIPTALPEVDEDAPGASRHEGKTGQVLIDALRSVEKDSAAERALLSVVDLLVAKSSDGHGNVSIPTISPKLLKRALAAVLTVLAVVHPTVSSYAEQLLSPTTALERKLNETLVQQAALQQQQAEDHATFIAMAKWVVDCQMAASDGRSMPKPPAPVRLILVQDELTQSTGQ